MTIFRPNNIDELKNFSGRKDKLAILERKKPVKASLFFNELIENSFSVFGEVHRETTLVDIRKILKDGIPKPIQNYPFYNDWINDMSSVCRAFCALENSNTISYSISSDRGCKRYHIDNVPQRLLVTYMGKGTEWVPDEAVDRAAHANGEPNENIVRDISAKKFINEWDIAVFKGGSNGLLHRTPDSELNVPSILMRLDHKNFWDEIINQRQS